MDEINDAVPENSRSKKMSEAQQIYCCQCGKKYLTFSALYLHAKIKHEIRLTTKKIEGNYRSQVINNKKYTTYFIKQTSQRVEVPQQNTGKADSKERTNDKKKENGQQLVDLVFEYLNHLQQKRQVIQEETESGQKKMVIKLFIKYLKLALKLLKDEEINQIFEPTYFFNEFVTYYLKKQLKQQFVSITKNSNEILFDLWRWLKQNGKVSSNLIMNQSFNPI